MPLNEWANTAINARKGYRRAWADRRAEGHEVNKNKVHRLWRAEGLQVSQRRRRKRVGASSGPILDADAANIPPGEPWRNGFVESFNNRLRDECLNRNQWLTLLHAQVSMVIFGCPLRLSGFC